MTDYRTMSLPIETERLTMQLWADTDVDDYRELVTERGELIVGRASRDEPEIAYELFRRVHSKGYATEAGRAILDAAIASGRRRLWSTVRSWNAPSFRVLEKLDFHRHHVTTDDKGDLVWLTRTVP
ncbi:MAG: GNAT family N-acetyltransferase [Jatrophihabitans sp.]